MFLQFLFCLVVFLRCLQVKYKEAGKKEVNTCLYSLLPETLQTQHAKETTELLSEVRSSFTESQHTAADCPDEDDMFSDYHLD